jgi:signal peptide peptidase SppA
MRCDLTMTAQPWAIEQRAGHLLADLITRRVNGERVAEAAPGAAAKAGKKGKPKPTAVAVIPLHGVMVQRADWYDELFGFVGSAQVGQAVDEAAADPEVEAIVLAVDSPGGSVFGTHELAAKVAAAAKRKRVVAVADAMAASAAYYVASQASELVVTPSGMVGSVGVYTMHVDRSQELAKYGIKVTLVSSTPEKVAGNQFEPLGDLGLSQQADIVQGYYKQFVKAVADGRRVSQAEVRDTFGKGGVVLADEAVRRGMADRVATIDDVLGKWGLSSADLTPAAAGETAPSAKGVDYAVEIRRRWLELNS